MERDIIVTSGEAITVTSSENYVSDTWWLLSRENLDTATLLLLWNKPKSEANFVHCAVVSYVEINTHYRMHASRSESFCEVFGHCSRGSWLVVGWFSSVWHPRLLIRHWYIMGIVSHGDKKASFFMARWPWFPSALIWCNLV